MKNILITMDLEDYFYDFGAEYNSSYYKDTLSCLELAVSRLENLLFQSGNTINFTIFVTGNLVDKYPEFIKQLSKNHEISSHLYFHDNVSELKQDEFENQIIRSIRSILRATNIWPLGYRSPNFKVLNDEYNSLKVLYKYFSYDSSLFNNSNNCYEGLIEFPIPCFQLFGYKIKVIGGTYLKFIPFIFLKKVIDNSIKSGNIPQIYVHPYELIFDFSFFYNPFKIKNCNIIKKLYLLLRQLQWIGPLNILFYLKLKYIIFNYKHIGRLDEWI
ncbi:DUF3473 domain-containing protein [Polynucleobacter sp. JS-JIR-5-A7]|uniref:DUF3473 domain-containing protein n=1 Tax=Polynucleobacter sp. JS-JIR-5-A7 TaxID=1758395 RepID=UPI001BFD2208|nr:DUF3473 domain-containing protein [Polynucleobacter sp. JS-JIR-5-A7]QWE06949.1 DUF3473 domain-containing protein [Polynucleobacter sp. JS-JIR-5-A7]